MFLLRLYERGGNPHENIIDELEAEIVPDVGDRVQVQASTHANPTAYEVVSRTFHFGRDQGRRVGVAMIFLEVSSAQAVLGNPRSVRGGHR